MPREDWAAIRSKPPTCLRVTTTFRPKRAGPSPSGSTLTEMREPCWYVTATWPCAPTAMSPKLPRPEPGITAGAPNATVEPSPVTGAPAAATNEPRLNVTHTESGPVATVGWSRSPSKRATVLNVAPASVLRTTLTPWSASRA